MTKRYQITTRILIRDMGYCCPFAFFYLFKRTALVATRLGVSTRAVRYAKASCTCERSKECLGPKLPWMKEILRSSSAHQKPLESVLPLRKEH